MNSEFLPGSWKIFVVAIYKPHPSTMRYGFVGKSFVVRLSTTKTMKILPPEKYPLYGICIAVAVHVVCISYTYYNEGNQ